MADKPHRQAGKSQKQKIEITTRMLEAGVYALERYYPDDEPTSDAVVRIFEAMMLAYREESSR